MTSEDTAVDPQVPEWYYLSSRQEILPFVPTTARRILDVGCGGGKFGEELKRRGTPIVWGIEYDKEAALSASEKLDNVFVGDAATLVSELAGESFDCVTCLDVLEHLVDPYTVLQEIKQILGDDGLLIVSVPNVLYISNLFRMLIKRDWEYVDHGVLDRTHLRFFTKKSLTRSLEELGYEIVRLEGVNPVRGILFPIFNLLTLGFYREARDLQFVCVVKLK